MRKLTTQLIVLFFLTNTGYSQKNSWFDNASAIRFSAGVESGLNLELGYGLLLTEFGGQDFPSGSVATTLGYEAYFFNNKFYGGPNVNLHFSFAFATIGLSASYINYQDVWKPIIKPEIGVTVIGLVSLSYSYTISDYDHFFPSSYNGHGVHLSVTIPTTLFFW